MKTAIVNPIYKPGKDPTKANSYRFISRTPSTGKLFWKYYMKNKLVARKKNKLDEGLIGFRPNRNTKDI